MGLSRFRPAQLALALLLEFRDEAFARKYYMRINNINIIYNYAGYKLDIFARHADLPYLPLKIAISKKSSIITTYEDIVFSN